MNIGSQFFFITNRSLGGPGGSGTDFILGMGDTLSKMSGMWGFYAIGGRRIHFNVGVLIFA